MVKCKNHNVDYVWQPAKDYGLKAQNWICPECEKEKQEFFSSLVKESGKESIEDLIRSQGDV